VKLVKPREGTKSLGSLFRAKILSVWLNGDLESAEVVVEEFAVVGRKKGFLLLDRESTATNGSRHIEVGAAAADFSGSIGDAIINLYGRFLARIEAACSNDDVANGRITEQAAVLNGMN